MTVVEAVIASVNALIALHLRFERTVRRDFQPNNPGYATFEQLRDATGIVDKMLSQHQRVINRFGGHKKPDPGSVQLNQATILWGILDALTGIYDTMRFSVVAHTLILRFAYAIQGQPNKWHPEVFGTKHPKADYEMKGKASKNQFLRCSLWYL